MSTVAQIKEKICELGEKPPPGMNKQDLLLYYEGLKEAKEKNIPPINVPKNLVLDYKAIRHDESIPWKENLKIYGWAVTTVPNFPLQDVLEGFYTWLERSFISGERSSPKIKSSCQRFSRNDPSTWKKKNMPFSSRGIFKNFIGHTEFLWKTREACLPVFSELWEEENLLVSFDGGCFLTGENDKDKTNWIHCDQGRKTREFACVQGIVNLLFNGEEDGGTLLMNKSHTKFSDYLDKHPYDGIKPFFPIDPFDEVLQDCEIIKPCLKPGEILLFESRVFHANVAPKKKESLRMCLYVSMMPRSKATKKELEKRINLAREGRMTGHWAYGPYFSICPKKPHYLYGKDYPEPEEEIAEMNETRKRLIGY